MLDEKRKEYLRKYEAINTRGICLKFNRKTDMDIINFLETVSNKQGYIKQLIREDLARLNEDE